MSELPPGVEVFDPEASKAQAARNFLVIVYGGYKTGKTDFWNQAQRPLYVVYLDTNPNLETHLIKSSKVWGDEVYKLVLPPMKYEELTEAIAKDYLDKIDKFAEWAKQHANERVAEGKYGGTFVVDGATYLKGYLEKYHLGESPTLGYRPKRGERAAYSTYDFVKPNGAMFDFIAGFTRQNLDACFVFEGRPVWGTGTDGKSFKTDKWRSTRPDRVPYAINAELETLKILERANPADNKSPMLSKFAIRTVYNSEEPKLDHLVLPADDHTLGFQRYKELLLAESVGIEFLQSIGARHEDEIVRVGNNGGALTGGEDDDAAEE